MALERIGHANKIHPESFSEICNGEPTTHQRKKHKAFIMQNREKSNPNGDATFGSQHVTSNQRSEKRNRKEVSLRV
jgi:hypothetical protein